MMPEKIHRGTRLLPALLAAALLPGCEKAKEAVSGVLEKTGVKEKTADAPAAPVEPLPGGVVHSITEATFESYKADPKRLVVVKFYADWCGPCRALAPTISAIAREFPDNTLFLEIDVDKNRGLTRKLGVRGIPDVRFYLGGKEVEKFNANLPASQVREMVARHAPNLADEEARLAAAPQPAVPAQPAPPAAPAPKASAQPDAKTSGGDENIAAKAMDMVGAVKDSLAGARNKAEAALSGKEPSTANKAGAEPAVPPIRPIPQSDQEWLPPGMSRGPMPQPAAGTQEAAPPPR